MPTARAHRVPKLCRHKGRNLAYVTIGGKQRYLGRWGAEDALQKYNRLMARHRIKGQ